VFIERIIVRFDDFLLIFGISTTETDQETEDSCKTKKVGKDKSVFHSVPPLVQTSYEIWQILFQNQQLVP
jgi:hypothetical protein